MCQAPARLGEMGTGFKQRGGTVRKKALTAFALVFLPTLLVGPSANADCNVLIAKARTFARDVSVIADPMQRVRVGTPISIKWADRPSGFRSWPQVPVYLVVMTVAEVRFAGSGFIALTAGAKGPEGLTLGADRARALVPLHRESPVAARGEIVVKPYRAGRQGIWWAVATAGACGEHILTRGETAFEVAPGAAELVLQERFSTEKPLKRIRAHTGAYDLLVFDGRYEVHDVATAAKIIDRAGNDPNFSPTGRFVAARRAADRGTEVLDIVSGEKVVDFLAGFLAWARADSFVFHGGEGAGNVAIANALVDRNPISFVGQLLSCRICHAWDDVDLVFDLDRHYVAALGNLEGRLADLVTQQTWDAGKRFGDPKTKEPQRSIMEGLIRRRFDTAFPAFPRGWTFVGDTVVLSHPDNGGLFSPKRPVEAGQQRLVLTHSAVAENAVAISAAPGRSGALLVSADLSSRGLARKPQLNRSLALDPSGIFSSLAVSGIATFALRPIVRVHDRVEATREGKSLEVAIEDIMRHVPEARVAMRDPEGVNHCIKDSTAVGQSAVPPRWVSQIYRWTTPQGSAWLVQTLCYAGSAGALNDDDVVLVIERGTGEKLRSIYKALGKAAEASGNWVHEANKVLAFNSDDGRIIVASRFGQSAAVIDVETAEREGVVISLASSDLLKELRRTVDGKHLVQLNTDGRFFLYRITDGMRILHGASVDDEIIIMSDDGLYDTTYEGAHAIQVRFGGMPGLFSFHQFESVLRRPDLANAILEGRDVPPRPAALPVPPRVKLTLDATPKNGQRAGTVFATSDQALKEVRLYADGRLIRTIKAEGVHFETAVDVPDAGGGRWVTAVAVDANDLVSLPSAIQIPGAPLPRGILRAVLAGVDTYGDPQIQQLASAKRDARKLAQVLAIAGKRAFAAVNTTLLVDGQVTPDSLLLSVTRAARETGPDDTLVVFFAGHGVDGAAFGRPGAGLMLVTNTTRTADLDRTALPWHAIAEVVAEARGKVVIVLDACHSGLAGHAFATNDAIVSTLFTRAGAPMVVLAASKGRQLSQETSRSGRFTNAFVAALTGERSSVDRDRSGLIDLGELYTAVKGRVVTETKGKQTPWLARNGYAGEMSLF